MNTIIILISLIVCLKTIYVQASSLNDWPIIGIFAQPSTSTEGNCNGNCQYIAASYVKYIEASGARVVPINFYSTNEQLDDIFNKVNGFFFPGGGSSFPKSAQYIFDKTVTANKAGDFSPLWGTCMGFQWLLLACSKDMNILDPSSGQMDAYNYSIPLDFTNTATSSKLFQPTEINMNMMKILATENVTMNNHHYGIWTDHFKSTSSLSSFFNLISTNKDRNGNEFVSTIESFDYPIFGSQWHPEKNNFEWGKTNGIPNEAINHSPHAVLASQYAADFFVNQARLSTHKYANSNEEDAALIDNYPVSKTTGSFMQTYFFHF